MKIQYKIMPSTERVFPSTLIRKTRPPSVEAALNETIRFQVAARIEEPAGKRAFEVRAEVVPPKGWTARVRAVGFVPVRHRNPPVLNDRLETDAAGLIPGYAPDPLFEQDVIELAYGETAAFWISLIPGRAATPGRHVARIILNEDDGGSSFLEMPFTIRDLALKQRKNFPVTHWFYSDAIIDWYKTDLFDGAFWKIARPYMLDMVEHGQDTVSAPVFTPPLDGVKRPCQLLHVSRGAPGKYVFDWSDVEKYVKLALQCGLKNFEWTHFFTQWGCRNAIRIYRGQGRDEKPLWPADTPAVSREYREFLAAFLPRFHAFLKKHGILNRSFFHLSDEPHGDEQMKSYREARAMLADLAPWIKVMDALSDISFSGPGLTDVPIPSISTALEFLKAGVKCWCYYCCGPTGRHINHLLDTAPGKIAMHGFLFYRWPFRGFLHWGYNYWCKSQTRELIDPYTAQDGLAWQKGWAYGDTFYVYPGERGPIDSIRWELFAEAMNDYRLLQTLGVERGDPLLAPIRAFDDFPKRPEWRARARSALFKRALKT